MRPWRSIRTKLLYPFLTMLAIFMMVSLFSYYTEHRLLEQINFLLNNSIVLKNFNSSIDNTTNYLEKYLISRDFNMFQKYYQYRQTVDVTYSNLTVVDRKPENYLLLENVKNMTRAFLIQADLAEQAKRARNSSAYHQAFNEIVRYNTNIKWAVERLITIQLEENSRQYLRVSQQLLFIQKLGIILLISSLIFSLVIAITTTFRLTKPLEKLSLAAETVSQGDFAIKPLDIITNDEIGVVTQAFNEMIAGITKLIAEIKSRSDLEIRLQEQELQNLVMKTVLREAELHALQSQINPHFLFNMLNAGVQLAVIEEAERTSDYIYKVASLLRYNLRKLDHPVTLREEIAHLETYFFILQTRYGSDRFQFLIELDPAIADFEIPLLTIQPLAENALIHGIEKLETRGEIQVCVSRQTEQIIIRVSDNGCGMDLETLRMLQQGIAANGHTTGIGLQNVHERLKRFFNLEEVMRIESVLDKGTTIELILPMTNGGIDARFSSG